MWKNNRPPTSRPSSTRNNNRPPTPRPSNRNNNNNNRDCNLFVPSSSQGSVFGDEDTYSDVNTDFGGRLNPSSSGFSCVSDDDVDVFSKLWPPMDFQEHYADGALDSDYRTWIEEFILADDEQLGYQSSEANCFSLVTSHGGATATASASRNGHVSLETEEDAVDSLPHPYLLQQDENGELIKHTVKGQSSEISNSKEETTDKNDGESWQEASADPQHKSNLIEMDNNAETSQPAGRSSFSAEGQIISREMHNSHVRFKIKSFTVPEFFIEVPETASVAFLKKAIMEKATAMVEDGGNLGVVLQSEENGDDNERLTKTNVSHQNKLDAILEPQYIQSFSGSSSHHSCAPLPPQPQTWCTPLSDVQGITDTWPDSLTSVLGTIFQDNSENGELHLVSEDQRIKASKCKKRPGMDENALDENSVGQNSSMNIKRRKTEFFSISEVEALVQTVEELGPGRWQKIKEQAFGNDSRRTYMDVKDKWRSLVKTAKRPVDERRGVCLPQGLLDRVLAIETCKSKK